MRASSLTRRYIAALCAVALMALVGQGLVQLMLVRQSDDAHVINVAGRQRMLSQKLSKAALAVEANSRLTERAQHLAELRSTLELWQTSHEGLQHGAPQRGLPGTNSAEIRALFASIEPFHQAMLLGANGLLQTSAETTALNVDRILANESAFLRGMDHIVSQYEQEAKGKVDVLRKIELTLLGATLVILALEGLFIFRPAARHIARSIQKLQDANAALKSEVSLRARVELELAEHAENLARSNADLEAFAYAASHDLKEPLRSIASCTQLLAERYKGRLDGGADELIAYTEKECNRLKQLINDLLVYSAIRTREKSPVAVDTAEALALAMRSLKLALEESGATISYEKLPVVTADLLQFSQVFLNLISNAIKYPGREPTQIHVYATRRDADWVFAVRDNGEGIDSRYFDKIFVPFKRLHGREIEGTGIGLALCKRIVEGHGGQMWFESKPGVGSTFYFSIMDGLENSGNP